MGIQGLLPLLKSIMSPIHIKQLEGCCVAVDTYSWLHKGALSCSTELCKGLPTSRHIDYCMHRVNMLRHYGVRPILVFDGGPLPMKGEQENKRARSRKENLARAIQHESSGNSAAAYECYQKAVDISPTIAYELIQVLKREGVHYIVAPYEADAQMAFLAITKQIDAVITEDSDLIAFGCPRIIYKMDKFGQGVEFQISMLQHNKDLSFAGFTGDMLLEMCILIGCDYLPSLPGLGPKRAHALISKFKTFEKVIKHLRYSSVTVSPDYEKLFKKALLTFRHQRVYDPNKEDIVHLSTISDDADGELDFLGPLLPQHKVKGIAIGQLDPITKLPFQKDNVQSPAFDTSYQLKAFRLENDKKKPDLTAQKNTLTNYFCFASLEAKRKFRVPQASPKHSDLNNEFSPTMSKHIHNNRTTCKLNNSSEFLNDPLNSSDVNSSHDSIDTKLSSGAIDAVDSSLTRDRNLFEQPPKPCLLLRKRHGHSNVSQKVPGTTNLHGQDPTAKLPCLQPKMVVEDDSNCITSKGALRSSYFLDKSDGNGSGGKSKRIIVRSSYFRHNKSTKPLRTVENDTQLVKDDSSLEGRREESHCEDLFIKRKASRAHTDFGDKSKNKLAWTEGYTEAEGVEAPADVNKSTEVILGEEKFGCNISHLEHYSDISGKTLNNFVSAVSSFKYNSSGARASGLRAPLRNIKNFHAYRAPDSRLDIEKFAYVPSNRKDARGTRKH